MANTATNRGKFLLANGDIRPGTTDLRLGLLGTAALTSTQHAAVPDVNTVADLLAVSGIDELTGVSGYARVALGSETASEDDTNDWGLVDSDDVSFPSLGTGDTLHGAFLFVHTGSDSTAEVISVHDVSPGKPTNGGTMTVTTGSGLLRLS